MTLLILFAFIAGAATALSPCVLPVLPAVLAAGATGERRRPLGVVIGLTLSFTFATVALVAAIDTLGLPDDITRKIAIVVLAGFGLLLLMPRLAARFEAAAGRLTARPISGRGDGFWSGVLLGAGLGFVYAPCAGPILSGVIVAGAAQEVSWRGFVVALAYGAGTGAVLYAILLGGRRLIARLRPSVPVFNAVMGGLMIAVALMLALNLDTDFETWLARNAPEAVVNPTADLERTAAIQDDLEEVRRAGGPAGPSFAQPSPHTPGGVATSGLPVLGVAPEFAETGDWFNSEPLSIEGLRGRVVLIDFWTYTCINCLRTLPQIEAWHERYAEDGLTIVGVHTPEFPFERSAENVANAIAVNDLGYPVVQDNDYGTWNAWGNQYWPAKYLIDAQGRVRYYHFGEGSYEQTEAAIRDLLAESGAARLGAETDQRVETADPGATTPETYLGLLRAEGYSTPVGPGVHAYALPDAGLARTGSLWGGGGG